MQVPRLPSFFKAQKIKVFNFKPRYYSKRKDEIEQLRKHGKKINNLFFNKKTKQTATRNRSKQLVIILITLFLFFYLLLT